MNTFEQHTGWPVFSLLSKHRTWVLAYGAEKGITAIPADSQISLQKVEFKSHPAWPLGTWGVLYRETLPC